MNITKTTFNFAAKRNLELEIIESGELTKLAVWDAEDDMEWVLTYLINEDGTLSFDNNIQLNQMAKEDLPAYIGNVKQLHNVIDFIAKEI